MYTSSSILGSQKKSDPSLQVLEETGYDLSDSFPPEQLQPDWVEEEGSPRNPYYVELVIKEQKIRLYLIPNIHEDTYFQTRTRKEISVSLHHNVDSLSARSEFRLCTHFKENRLVPSE